MYLVSLNINLIIHLLHSWFCQGIIMYVMVLMSRITYSMFHKSLSRSLCVYYPCFPCAAGELHVPLEVCGAVVKRELNYWQINENHIKACCWRNYRSYIENKRILDSFNRSILKQQMNIKTDGMQGWEKVRTQMWLILEYPRTSQVAMVRNI